MYDLVSDATRGAKDESKAALPLAVESVVLWVEVEASEAVEADLDAPWQHRCTGSRVAIGLLERRRPQH